VTAADLLAGAAFEEGSYAQSFPSFGSERTGAPVVAYCRLSDREIRTREPVVNPDCLLIIDPTLIHQVDLLSGLRADGFVLVNTARPMSELEVGRLLSGQRPSRLVTAPATDVALTRIGRPLPNAALLGGFAALTGQVSLHAVCTAIRTRFGHNHGLAEANVAAASDLYDHVRASMETMAPQQPRAELNAASA